MLTDEKINLLAAIARTPQAARTEGSADRSILMLAAASYGARPSDESTVPTGFDPFAAALFECIVEGAYLVATADGIFDDEERHTFERIVTAACGGAVPHGHIADLVADLAAQLAEDGLEQRIQRVAAALSRREHAHEVLRIAALIAQVSDDVSDVERGVLEKLAAACDLGSLDVDQALLDARASLETPTQS
jgi:tellurite resistance protein